MDLQILLVNQVPIVCIVLTAGPDQERKVRRRRNQTKKERRSQGDEYDPAFDFHQNRS